ncbi:hypothetical protein KSP40_PGU016158 [Platanthera guangdongensis]|uniref:Uncharacterized protein n=1 Tax=Platanthera guangdongensis TaxID=2320717 RepID=A0ABR2MLL1_9ASPA
MLTSSPCHKKQVQITVYVVNSRSGLTKQASSQELRAANRPSGAASCYDRKAQLLLYSRQMRAFARRKPPPAIHKPQPPQKAIEFIQIALSHKSQPQKNAAEVIQIAANPKPRQHTAANRQTQHLAVKAVQNYSAAAKLKVVPVEDKPADEKLSPPPSCFGDWRKFLLPNFMKRSFDRRRTEKKKCTKIKKPVHSLSAKMNAIMRVKSLMAM